MKRIRLNILLIIIPVLIACNNLTGPEVIITEPDTITNRTINDILINLPEVEFNLPDSLKDGNNSVPSASMSRALNDITSFTLLSSEPGVKANGWYRMKEATSGSGNSAPTFIKYIKHFANFVDFECEKNIQLGVLSLPSGHVSPTGETTMDMGTIYIKQRTNTKLTIYWTVDIPSFAKFHIKINTEELNSGAMDVESFILYESHDSPGIVNNFSYSTYNSNNGEVFTFFDNSIYGEVGSYSINSLTYDSVGTAKFFDRYYSSNTDNSITVAWGNDYMGGVAQSYKYSWDNEGSVIDEEGLYVEFYDENGFLVKEGWGTADLQSQFWGLNWYDSSISNSYNLNSIVSIKPDSFTIEHGPSNILIKVDDVEVANITGLDYWNFYWKNGSDWYSGDSTYYCTDWSWDGINTNTGTYKINYTVPTSTSYLGGSYYMNNSFPLRYLAVNKNGYILKNKEGVTTTNYWTDENNNEYSWSWTDYTWWLDNNSYGTTNLVDSYDIPLSGNLYDRDYYIWDSAAGQSIKQKAYVYQSNKEVPSDLFLFTKAYLVDNIKYELETFFNESKNTYTTNPINTLNFPELLEFPTAVDITEYENVYTIYLPYNSTDEEKNKILEFGIDTIKNIAEKIVTDFLNIHIPFVPSFIVSIINEMAIVGPASYFESFITIYGEEVDTIGTYQSFIPIIYYNSGSYTQHPDIIIKIQKENGLFSWETVDTIRLLSASDIELSHLIIPKKEVEILIPGNYRIQLNSVTTQEFQVIDYIGM